MPLIDVTYGGSVDEEVLRRLGELLPTAFRTFRSGRSACG